MSLLKLPTRPRTKLWQPDSILLRSAQSMSSSSSSGRGIAAAAAISSSILHAMKTIPDSEGVCHYINCVYSERGVAESLSASDKHIDCSLTSSVQRGQ
jgi:hypothetical protein